MNNISKQILINIFLLIFISCGEKRLFRHDNLPKTVIPVVSRDSDMDSEKKNKSPVKRETLPQPRVNIGSNYTILYIKNINLDFDVEDEQVIVAAPRDDKQNIKITVLDFDSVRNKYIITWEAEKTNINHRSIAVSYIDTVGDHNLEIVFSAITLNNNHLIDIFRKTHSPSGIRLYYESICSIELNGQIELVEKERSQAYNLGQKNGNSFPVITYQENNKNQDEGQKLLKTTYMWNYQASKYINAFQEDIPAEILEEQKINKMFFDGIDGYKTFLEGQWYNIDSDDLIIRFNKNDSEITFFTSDILEIYKWSEFNFSRLNRIIDIYARNDLIHFITKRISIKIDSMNRIKIEVKDRENPKDIDQMNGYYQRISEDVISSIYNSREDKSESVVLSGEFSGSSGTISFNGHNFSLFSAQAEKKGIYSIYNYNKDLILELRVIDDNYLLKETLLFKLVYDEKEMEQSIINRILLTKGVVTANTFKTSGEDQLQFIQTIEKIKS
jgi:hypothetical protein